MNSFNQISKEFENNERLQKESLNAQSKYNEKPFALEYYSLKMIVQYSLPFFSLLSIALAFGYLLSKFGMVLPFVFSLIFSGILLVILELLKARFLKFGFENMLKGKGISIALLGIGSLFTVVSIFLSVFGIGEIYKILDNRKEVLSLNHDSKIDSLNAFYNTKENEVISSKNAFIQSVSYQGKINIYDKTTKTQLENFDNRLLSIAEEKKKTIESLSQTKESKESIIKDEFGENLTFWICLSASNETIILLCNFFLAYFSFKTFREIEVVQGYSNLQSNKNQVLNIFSQYLQGNSQLLNSMTANNQGNETNQVLGFKVGINPQKQEIQRDFKENDTIPNPNKIQALENDLRSGLLDTRTLCKKHKVNVVQVARAKERLGIKSKKAYA